MKLCLEPGRAPPRAAGDARLPPVREPADLVVALGTIAKAVSSGELTPEEGRALSAMLEVQRKAIETADIEARLRGAGGTEQRPMTVRLWRQLDAIERLYDGGGGDPVLITVHGGLDDELRHATA